MDSLVMFAKECENKMAPPDVARRRIFATATVGIPLKAVCTPVGRAFPKIARPTGMSSGWARTRTQSCCCLFLIRLPSSKPTLTRNSAPDTTAGIASAQRVIRCALKANTNAAVVRQ